MDRYLCGKIPDKNVKRKVSVIIPVFNEEELLPRLLECLKKQQKVILQVIVADADSTDKSKSIAKKYGALVVKGGKPGPGRNRGTRQAKYETLLFLDADVTFDDNFIIHCLEKMEQRGIMIAGILGKPDSSKFLDHLFFSFWNVWCWSMQKINPHAAGYCIFSNKSIHDSINGFDEQITLGEDANYVMRASKRGKFGMIRGSLVTSPRRLDKEGYLGMSIKMITCGIYRAFGKEDRGDRFRYEFDHKDNDKESVT